MICPICGNFMKPYYIDIKDKNGNVIHHLKSVYYICPEDGTLGHEETNFQVQTFDTGDFVTYNIFNYPLGYRSDITEKQEKLIQDMILTLDQSYPDIASKKMASKWISDHMDIYLKARNKFSNGY